MFVFCMLYSKEQKTKPGQSEQSCTDKVHRTKKNPTEGMDFRILWLLLVVQAVVSATS